MKLCYLNISYFLLSLLTESCVVATWVDDTFDEMWTFNEQWDLLGKDRLFTKAGEEVCTKLKGYAVYF